MKCTHVISFEKNNFSSGNLYLSDYNFAQNADSLEKFNIKAVITVAKECNITYPSVKFGFLC